MLEQAQQTLLPDRPSRLLSLDLRLPPGRIVLFKTLKRAIDGKPFASDKLERTATMSKATEKLTT